MLVALAAYYDIAGGVATVVALGAVPTIPSMGWSAELALGSEAIAGFGGLSTEEYEFLEIRDISAACTGAQIAYGVQIGWFAVEVAGARNPLKLPGLFLRVKLRVAAVVATALAINHLCNEDET